MKRTIVLLATMALTLLVASGVVLAAGIGGAGAQSSVVGPGKSIQKAINAAHPGDTIVVRGVHHEDVAIRKDGIKLRGDDAVIKPPAKADSPCAPEAICILGDMNFQTGEITGPRVSDVSVSGFTIRDFQEALALDVLHARNATVAGNRAIDIAGGIGITASSINTTITNNDVIGNPKTNSSGIAVEFSSNTTIAKNLVRNIPVGENAIGADHGTTNTTIEGNDLISDWVGVYVVDAPGTKVLSNDMSRTGIVGTYVAGPKSQDAKVVGNNISGGPWGIFVEGTYGGSVVGNNVRDNCAGMFFEAFKSQPVGGFWVSGNTVEDNTRSCRGQKFGRKFSGIGIALLGASGMQLTGNHLSGNVPSGPTPVSGGVVVSKDPYFRGTKFGGTQKPKNNSVIANHFGRNKPDIFYDGSGSGNQFRANYCDTSVPTSLCK
jgi:nitrous oxidase accessory protein NosD